MKTTKIRRNEVLPRARDAGLLPEAVIVLMDEADRLRELYAEHVDPDSARPELAIGADPVKVAKAREKIEEAKRHAAAVRDVISGATTANRAAIKRATVEHADNIIEGSLRDAAADLVAQASPLAATLSRFGPGFDMDQIHNDGNADEIVAADTVAPLYNQWRLICQTWDELRSAVYSPGSGSGRAYPPDIEAWLLFENPEHVNGTWTVRQGRLPHQVYELAAVAAEPEAAGFRLASPREAAALLPTLTRDDPYEPLRRNR